MLDRGIYLIIPVPQDRVIEPQTRNIQETGDRYHRPVMTLNAKTRLGHTTSKRIVCSPELQKHRASARAVRMMGNTSVVTETIA